MEKATISHIMVEAKAMLADHTTRMAVICDHLQVVDTKAHQEVEMVAKAPTENLNTRI